MLNHINTYNDAFTFLSGNAKSAPAKSMNIPRGLAQGKLQVQDEDDDKPSQETEDSSQPTEDHSSSAASNHATSKTRSSKTATSQRTSSSTHGDGRARTAAALGKPPSGPASSARRGSESAGGAADVKPVRMVLEVQRGPTKQEIRESLNVPEIMDHGGDLS